MLFWRGFGPGPGRRGGDGVRLQKKVDSTQELLEIIRNGEERPPAAAEPQKKAAPARRRKAAPRLRGARSAVGVDIREEAIDVARLSGGRLAAVEHVPLDADHRPGSAGFVPVLRDTLKRHCGLGRKAALWALFHSGEFDIGPVLIPRVPARKVNDTVIWTLKKDKKFEEKESLLDFVVLGQVRDSGVPKIEVLTCLAARSEVDWLKNAFAEAGFRPSGIVTIPNAFQNVYRSRLALAGGLCANIHVNAGFSCITIHSADKILFSRTIKSGTNSMAEALFEHLAASRPDITAEQARGLFAGRMLGRPPEPDAPELALSEDECLEIINPALERLVRQVERTLDFYATKHNERCDELHLSGGIFVNSRISEYMSSQLGIRGGVFDPLAGLPGPAAGLEPIERLSATLALAAAMSEPEATLNLACTYKERAQARKAAFVSDLIAAAAILLALAGSVAFLAEKVTARQKRDVLAGLEQKVARFSPLVDEQKLLSLAGEVLKNQAEMRALGRRYEVLALLGEVAALTPENVRLLNVSLDLGRAGQETKAPPDKQKPAQPQPQAAKIEPGRQIVLDGIVLGRDAEQERTLTRLLINIEGSPLFRAPEIRTSQVQEFSPEGKVLHFVLQLGLV